jgi:hypothetical protein
MLRSCTLTYQGQWDECLPLAEFSYNNSYQERIKMAPLNWSEPGERWFYGVDLVKKMKEKVKQIQKSLKVAQSR